LLEVGVLLLFLYESLSSFQVEVQEPELLKRKREEPEAIKENETQNHSVLPIKKKKKEFLGKTNFVNDDAFEDILASGWFYIDSSGIPQGPFSSKEMKEWFIAGFFFDNTLVKRINDPDYEPISGCELFKHCELSSNVVSTDIYTTTQNNQEVIKLPEKLESKSTLSTRFNPCYDPVPYYEDDSEEKGLYTQTAFFNTHNGRFTPVNSYYAARGIPEDRDGRMLSHYLDIDEYQEKMRAAKTNVDPNARPKISKKMISAFKKKKIDKQRRRILMM